MATTGQSQWTFTSSENTEDCGKLILRRQLEREQSNPRQKRVNLSRSLPRRIRREVRQKSCDYFSGFLGRTMLSPFPTAQAALVNPHEFRQPLLSQTKRPANCLET